jgi:hypothetical protein
MTMLFKDGKPSTPSGFKVAPQSYENLEEISNGLRGIFPVFPGEPYRIDCVRLLEQTLARAGFHFKIAEVDDLSDCAAFAVPDEHFLVFREDIYELLHQENVYGRSTVVHETSHIVLNHAVTLHRGARLGEHRHCEDSEWQAKALTAAIMMPITACRLARLPRDLASMCGTSVQAATYRLDRLVKAGIVER